MLKTRYNIRKFGQSFRVVKEFDNHEMVIAVTDTETKLRGYIAIHNTNLGPAIGGTRLQKYSSEEAALRDVLNLSKAMSYKCALAGLPLGGGKGVIIHEETADRDMLLASYAKMVEKLSGLFRTGTDMGILDDDVKKMSRHTQHMLGVSKADRGDLTTSKMAALGVYYCIKTALVHAYGSDSLQGRTIGVKGVGKLGSELVRLLHSEGAKIVVADINEQPVKTILRKYPGSIAVSPGEIHKQKLDVYSPCALGGELTMKVIKELRTKIIVGGANNQLASDAVGDKLFEMGILYAPDYITNAGGLIYVADELEKDGFHKQRVMDRVKHIQGTLQQVLSVSDRQKIATHRIANELGLKRIIEGKT